MEVESRILLSAVADLIELSLEPRIVEQTHNYYFQAIVAASLQHQLDLIQLFKPSKFFLLLQKQYIYIHPYTLLWNVA